MGWIPVAFYVKTVGSPYSFSFGYVAVKLSNCELERYKEALKVANEKEGSALFDWSCVSTGVYAVYEHMLDTVPVFQRSSSQFSSLILVLSLTEAVAFRNETSRHERKWCQTAFLSMPSNRRPCL